MRDISQEELKQILANHKTWLDSNGEQGARADLRGVDLQEANLQEAKLIGANLQEANLIEANLIEANLQRADLRGAVLFDAVLFKADLFKADLFKAVLFRADLQEADLQEADLQEADLQEADLQEADLQEADLLGANLRGANLRGANLRGANLEGVDLDNAINVAKEYLPPPKNKGSQSDYAQVQREAQKEIERLQAKVRDLEKSNNNADKGSDNKRGVAELQRRIEEAEERAANAEKRGDQQNELEAAIGKIQSATQSDEKLIKRYQNQSIFFMSAGIAAYIGAIVFAFIFSFDLLSYVDSFLGLKLNFNPIALGLLLSLVGTACLRHDWKIRQLSAQLLKQHNKVDLARGILNASLHLEFLADKEGKVDESFDLVRQALLFPDSPADAPSLQEDKQNNLLQTILEAVKNDK